MRSRLPFVIAVLPLSVMSQSIYSENFDDLHPGDRISATMPLQWRTWNDLSGTPEDAPVTDAFSLSAPYSLRFLQTTFGSLGGPVDQMLLLGDRQFGKYVLSWSMYVPTDRGAFMELLHSTDGASAIPAAVFTFNNYNGPTNLQMRMDGQEFNSTFNHNSWMNLVFGFDLDTHMATFSVNGTVRASWTFDTMPSGLSTINQLSAMRFFSFGGGAGAIGEYYIDDLLFTEGSVGVEEISASRPIRFAPNPTSGPTTLSMDSPLGVTDVDIHDASGRLVRHAPWPSGSAQFTLPAHVLAPGTYLVRVSEADTPGYTGRLVVMP